MNSVAPLLSIRPPPWKNFLDPCMFMLKFVLLHDFNKLKPLLPENESTQATVLLANWIGEYDW